MRLYSFALGIIFFCSLTLNAAKTAQLVKYGGDEEMDACSTLASVANLGSAADEFLAVKASPSIKAKRIDKLLKGQTFWVCDETKEWYGVVYTKEAKQECGVTSPIKTKSEYKGPCKSGWVNKKYVELEAG